MEIIKLSDFKRKNFSKAVNELYQLTDFNNSQYPNYMEWFFGKNMPRIIRGEGDVLFTLDGLRCIGACGIAPAITINGKVYPKVKLADIPNIIKEYRDKEME